MLLQIMFDSTLAYQGGGRGLDINGYRINRFATNNLILMLLFF